MYTVKLIKIEELSSYDKPSTVFLNPSKDTMAWKIIKPERPCFAPACTVEPSLEPNQFASLSDALSYLGAQKPQAVIYSSPELDDEQAKLLSDFIKNCESLISISYHYNTTGGYAYRQPYNKLSDKGYTLITQAVDMNPRMMSCGIGNHGISEALSTARSEIMKRNLQAFNIKDPVERVVAYRKIYQALQEKYNLPESFVSAAPLCQMPTLMAIAKYNIESHVLTSPLPMERLPFELLSSLEPPTVALAQEMERLSLLRTVEARKSEMLYLWKTVHAEKGETASVAREKMLPYFYCPPRLF